jgi:hypothetical protein
MIPIGAETLLTQELYNYQFSVFICNLLILRINYNSMKRQSFVFFVNILLLDGQNGEWWDATV